MKTNQAGINVIKKWESCRLKAYRCPSGKWTIGYGHTKNVKPGDVITAEKAIQLLEEDVAEREQFLEALNIKLNDNQFSAVVSLIFNIGTGNFYKSPVYKQIRVNPNHPWIKAAFLRHIYGRATSDGIDNDLDGLVDEAGEYMRLPGLVKRRRDEIDLYFTI